MVANYKHNIAIHHVKGAVGIFDITNGDTLKANVNYTVVPLYNLVTATNVVLQGK